MQSSENIATLNNYFSFGGYPENEAVDLCVRRKRPPSSPISSPPPTKTHDSIKQENHDEHSQLCNSSPLDSSNSSDSRLTIDEPRSNLTNHQEGLCHLPSHSPAHQLSTMMTQPDSRLLTPPDSRDPNTHDESKTQEMYMMSKRQMLQSSPHSMDLINEQSLETPSYKSDSQQSGMNTPPQSLSPMSQPSHSPFLESPHKHGISDDNNNDNKTQKKSKNVTSLELAAPLKITNSFNQNLLSRSYQGHENSFSALSPSSLNGLSSIQHLPGMTIQPLISPGSGGHPPTHLELNGGQPTICPITKNVRPFKAYTKSKLNILPGDAILNVDMSPEYQEYKEAMLKQLNNNNTTNKNMRRNTSANGQHVDDPQYWEKRRKNNEAAKRSRDARRAKEDEIAIRCSFLERENMRLKYELAAIQSQWERARMFYNLR